MDCVGVVPPQPFSGVNMPSVIDEHQHRRMSPAAERRFRLADRQKGNRGLTVWLCVIVSPSIVRYATETP